MWMEPHELSEWTYHYCRDVKDDPDIRSLITDSEWAFYYCNTIKDITTVRNHITAPYWLSHYNFYIKKYNQKLKGE